jgi:hypothetical protein
LLAGWGNVAPFVLRSGSQFRPEAPLALNSEEYARDYNEIKEIGSAASTTRTGLQSQIATFWRASPTAIWNPVIRQSLAARSFDLSETARAYALFYLAASDASVACWDAKYVYNFWRPQSAIRRGSEDGNDATEADPTWTPFIATPPHPEYASGHATNSSSMAAVLESLFGKDPEMTISVTLSGITRQWTTFDEAVGGHRRPRILRDPFPKLGRCRRAPRAPSGSVRHDPCLTALPRKRIPMRMRSK